MYEWMHTCMNELKDECVHEKALHMYTPLALTDLLQCNLLIQRGSNFTHINHLPTHHSYPSINSPKHARTSWHKVVLGLLKILAKSLFIRLMASPHHSCTHENACIQQKKSTYPWILKTNLICVRIVLVVDVMPCEMCCDPPPSTLPLHAFSRCINT
jgi:hypothetical protein